MRAKQFVSVTRELYKELGMTVVDLPPVDWFVRGPRGGLYEATGERTRYVEDKNMLDQDWMSGRDVVYVIDQSEGLRYLRPGTKRHAEASANT